MTNFSPPASMVWEEEVTDGRTDGHQAFWNRCLYKITEVPPCFALEGYFQKGSIKG